MSDPILPLVPIAEGTTQIDIEANDNFLRLEALSRPCLGVANDAAGGDAQGDVWLVGDTPTGAFATFDENDIAIFDGTGWHAWAPVDGLRLVVNDVRKAWSGSAWGDDPSISGGGGSATLEIVSEASAFTADPATHAGTNRLILAGGDVTFDSAEGYTAGQVYSLRATAAIDLTGAGVTLDPPAGGTLALTAAMAVTVVMTSGTTGAVIGQTVAA